MENIYNIVDLEIEEHIISWVNERGIEGAEELIYNSTSHPLMRRLRNKVLIMFYKKYPFLYKP